MKNDNSKQDAAPDPAVPSPASAAAPTPAAPSSIDQKIDQWFAKHFHNLGALLDERMHNVIQTAKEDLKAELAKL